MTKVNLTSEAAKAIIKRGTPIQTKAIQRVPRIVDSPVEQPTGGGETIELAYLQSAPYTSDSKTVSDAYLCNEAGNKDTSQPITIVWRGALSVDKNAFLTGRYIWVTKRNNEWVALSQTTAHSSNYTAGDGISISSNVITNTGVKKFCRASDATKWTTKGPLYVGHGLDIFHYMDSVLTDGSYGDGLGVKTRGYTYVSGVSLENGELVFDTGTVQGVDTTS